MKKVMILSAFSLLMFDHSVFAKEAASPADTKTMEFVMSVINNDKIPVKIEELPQAVKTTLASDAYAGWAVSEAFLVKAETEYYEITLKKEAEVRTVKLSKEGTVVQ